MISFSIWFVLQHAAGTDVAAAVVGLGVLALGNTAAASRVDEVESVVIVDAGDDANVSHTTTARTALEEHEVARLQLGLLHAHTIKNLASRRAVEIDAETLEYIAGKAGAVKSAGGHGSITIRRTTEAVCVIDDLINDVVTAVLLKLFEHGSALAVGQLLSLYREAGNGD